MQDPDQLLGQVVSHYRLLAKLGEGGMGVVFLAEDTHLGRRVAVKFLNATGDEHHFRARFLREARAVSSLSHPNIAAVFDYGETKDGQPFIVMELVEGQTLSEMLDEDALTLQRAVEIIADVAAALSEAHARGIIHRDIKPSNVIVNKRNQVKVLDFGLAKQLNEEQVQADPKARTLLATHTQSNIVVGTPLYLSPEQATGGQVDARSDLFSLGALLFECITGQQTFSGGSLIEIGAQVLHVDPPPPSKINPHAPEELDRITLKALQKKPDARYQSAAEMEAELRAVRATLDAEPQPARRAARAKQVKTPSALSTLSTSLRRPRLSILSLFIALAAIVTLTVFIYRWSRPSVHVPPPEAVRWYERGTELLRDGAYYQASKSLEQAIKIDGDYALARARLAEAWAEMDYMDKAKDELLKVGSLVPDRSALGQLDALYLDAINAVISRDSARAIKAYSAIAQLKPDQPQVYVDLGRAYEQSYETNKAISNYILATNHDRHYATAFLRLALLYDRNQNMTSALSALDNAESSYAASANIEGETQVHYERGRMLVKLGRNDEARAQLERALEMSRANGYESQQINTLLQFSRLYFTAGDPLRAQQYAQDAIDFAQSKGLENLIARGFTELGNAYYLSGNYQKAEELYNKALEFARRNRALYTVALNLLNLADVQLQQLRTDESLKNVQQAIAFFQQAGYRRDLSLALTTLGRAHRRKLDFAAALEAFQKKLELDREVNDQSQIAFSFGEMGTLLAEQERFPESLNYYEQSFAINKVLDERRLIAYNLMNRGNVFWRLGRYTDAEGVLNEATERAQQPDAGYRQVLAEIQTIKAEIALSQRRFQDARALSQQVIDSFGSNYKDLTIRAKYTLGLAQALAGDRRAGRRTCEEAIEIATMESDVSLFSRSMLALAEAALESGDAQTALTAALKAQESFARVGQQESEWRAWLVAARASARKGDTQAAQQQMKSAAHALTQLQQRWGDEAFNNYLKRPDIEFSHKQLGAAVGDGL